MARPGTRPAPRGQLHVGRYFAASSPLLTALLAGVVFLAGGDGPLTPASAWTCRAAPASC